MCVCACFFEVSKQKVCKYISYVENERELELNKTDDVVRMYSTCTHTHAYIHTHTHLQSLRLLAESESLPRKLPELKVRIVRHVPSVGPHHLLVVVASLGKEVWLELGNGPQVKLSLPSCYLLQLLDYVVQSWGRERGEIEIDREMVAIIPDQPFMHNFKCQRLCMHNRISIYCMLLVQDPGGQLNV